jgi:hypothetical protein
MEAKTVLVKVEKGRLYKAVEGLASGAYTITVTGQGEAEVRGFVANGDGREYGVVLTRGQAFCSCKDAIYRRSVCKHAVALALSVIRNPQVQEARAEGRPAAESTPDLRLVKTRPGWAYSA